MEQGNICIYAGDGNGSTLAALGRALQTAGRGKQVVLIRLDRKSTRLNSSHMA